MLFSLSMDSFAYKASYSGCQKNVPIEKHFSVTTLYAAILFSEHDLTSGIKL